MPLQIDTHMAGNISATDPAEESLQGSADKHLDKMII
jgi:hypothetical protein